MTKEIILSSKFYSQDQLATACGDRLHTIVIDKLCEFAFGDEIIKCGNYCLEPKGTGFFRIFDEGFVTDRMTTIYYVAKFLIEHGVAHDLWY